ncbi:MAG TPA: response regulator transcription factor [Flavobacteriales bacterium]|nr:response regulator transcription factor [Flavobacteriales bacterium]HIN39862.1 response regulator transcription factor [Flavobacteriales bacterium]
MLKTIIVEDEEKASLNLKNILHEYCENVEVVDMQEGVASGIASIKKHKPDLVFLDVKMRGETGFDLLEQIDDINFEIIFTTAHNEYALKAFKFSAIHYLLKPIDIEQLVDAVQRVKEIKNHKFNKVRFDMAIENLKDQKNTFRKIALPTVDGLIFIQIEDIIRCESEDNYTYFILQNETRVLVSKTIKHYEELLVEHNFFRVHQSHLINLNHITKYHKGEGGYATMADGSSVPVSRRKKIAFLNTLSSL